MSVRKASHRRADFEHVAGPQIRRQIPRHQAAGLRTDSQSEAVGAGRGHDGIGSAFVAILNRAAHGDVLARAMRKGFAQRRRNLDGHAGRILGRALNRGHLQWMKAQARHVKCT